MSPRRPKARVPAHPRDSQNPCWPPLTTEDWQDPALAVAAPNNSRGSQRAVAICGASLRPFAHTTIPHLPGLCGVFVLCNLFGELCRTLESLAVPLDCDVLLSCIRNLLQGKANSLL